MKKTFTDQMQRSVSVAYPPQRIISLVPSQTELLAELGLLPQLIGRTKFCIHPYTQLSAVPIVGGTKNFRFSTIHTLKPDLIIGNKEENYREGIEELATQYPVWMSDINTLDDALEMIRQVGHVTNTEHRAGQLAIQIQQSLEEVRQIWKGQKVLYLIWKKPWMAAGKHTFIDAMLNYIGFENCISQSRYPQLTDNELRDLSPDVVMLSSEPYPFKAPEQADLQVWWPTSRVILADGEMFSWYGSRLQHAASYIKNLHNSLTNTRISFTQNHIRP
jgi:ABC-type Fe3+-hydroxamate transport system substrate-binding protein